MAVTIKDIAKKAGVSHTTVSRALNDHPAISKETVGRIKLLAEELDYVPSAAARGLKTNRSLVLGVIVHRIEDPFLTDVLRGIEDTLNPSEYSLFLAATKRDPEREKRVIQAMAERRVDGIIFSSLYIGVQQLRYLKQIDIPIVLINNQTMQDPDVYLVYHQDVEATRQLTQHLVDLGHRKIAYLGSARSGRTNVKRQQGYEEGLEKAGLPLCPEYIISGTTSRPENGINGMNGLLALADPPTAVICYNDMIAIGAIKAITQAGLSVPHDISVAGFDNIDLAQYVTPPLTTFHQPRYQLGQEAAKMILHILQQDKGAQRPDAVVLHGELIIRQSTASPH